MCSVECRKPLDVKLIVLGVVISILVVGILALLAWKAVVTIHDRREFARFQEEFKKSRWNVVSTARHQSRTAKTISVLLKQRHHIA